MEPASQTLTERAAALWEGAAAYAAQALRPGWTLWQLLILAALAAAAYGLTRLLDPRLRAWLRAREGWPMWRLRVGTLVRRRLPLILFVALAWATVLVMREATWPSRSYLLGIAATIASAWLAIGLASRVIRNRPLRRLVAVGLAAWATVRLLGVEPEAAAMLDGLALDTGALRISLLDVILAAAIIGALLFAAVTVARLAADRIAASEDISPSMRVLSVKFLQLGLYSLAVFAGLRAVGVDLTGLAFLSGAVALGLGFGLQKVVSNLISGVIILLDKSIKPGDVISLGETFGWINALGARYVSVVTRDGKEYLIPNEDLITGQVVNWSHSNEFVRLDITFGISYRDDPHAVRRVAVAAAAGVPRVLAQPNAPVCHITGFGDSSVDFVLRFWIADPAAGLTNIRGNVFLALWDAFHAEGFSIPFPQREVRVLGDGGGGGDH